MLEELQGSLRRVLSLRQFAPFAGVDLGELATLAENLVETTLLHGNRVVNAGARMPALHLIVDGKIEAGGESFGPRQMFGLLEVLAREPSDAQAIATVDTRVFRISAGDARELLEDNVGLMRAVLGELAGKTLEGGHDFGFGTPAAPFGDRMTLVERLIALRQHSPFAGARLQALTAVAQLVEQRRWKPGDRLVEAAATSETVMFVLDGALRAGPKLIEPGGAIGALEAFAGVPHGVAVEAETAAMTLSCSVAALHDVLEDHADLGLAMLSTLAKRLLAAARTRNN